MKNKIEGKNEMKSRREENRGNGGQWSGKKKNRERVYGKKQIKIIEKKLNESQLLAFYKEMT